MRVFFLTGSHLKGGFCVLAFGKKPKVCFKSQVKLIFQNSSVRGVCDGP